MANAEQGASFPAAEIVPPEQGNEPEIQPKKDKKKTILDGLSQGGPKKGMIVLLGVIGVALMIVILHTAPKKRVVANPGPQQPRQQQQQQAPQETDSLPTENSQTQQQGVDSSPGDITPDMIQRSTQQGPQRKQVSSGDGDQSTGNRAPHTNERLEQVPAFTPPPVPGSGNGQWTPPAYNGGSANSGSPDTTKTIATARRVALTTASMTYVDQPLTQGSVASQQAGKETQATIDNLGYRPGYHLATHLEDVASTAVSAPIIAVVDFDYQRDGITIIPAGSRLIGSMGASNSTGIVNLHFSSIRMPNGNTVAIAAVGLNHQLQALKGIVTGRHVVQQFLMASLAGLGSNAALFAGNNVNGQLTEADVLKSQVANNEGSVLNNQISTLQQSVSQSIVVTLPAGTEVEAMFTSEGKPQEVSAATQTAPRP